jgi:hypothetical protein
LWYLFSYLLFLLEIAKKGPKQMTYKDMTFCTAKNCGKLDCPGTQIDRTFSQSLPTEYRGQGSAPAQSTES